MRRPTSPGFAFALFVWAALASGAARGEDARVAAHEHFDKGLAASNDQRFAEAVTEFEKAYELWPDYRVLYNVGKVRATLGRSAEAVAAFETYLQQGGAEIAPERKQEVRDAMAAQLAHVGAIEVRVSYDGAEVRIDGRLIGRSPLRAPVRLTEGKHTVEALLPGRPPQLREVELPGAAALTIELTFPPPPKLEAPPAVVAPAPAPAPTLLTASPPATAPLRPLRAVGYAVAGAGLVATVVGAVVAYTAARDANAQRALLVEAAMPQPPGTPDVLKYDGARRAFDDARTRNQLGWAVVGVGAAVLVGGVTLAIVAPGTSDRATAVAIGGRW